MTTFTIPIRTISEANSHQHWRLRAKRAKAQRGVARLLTNHALVASGSYAYAFSLGRKTPFPLVVTLTRIGPRRLDSDNLAGSMKHVRDGIADALLVDDGDEARVTWRYEQTKGKAKTFGITVTIEERT